MLNIIKKSPSNTKATVLSSEKIYRMGFDFHGGKSQETVNSNRLRKKFLERLSSEVLDYDVTILLFFRRVDDFAESLYKEQAFRTRYEGVYGFQDFLDEQSVLFDYTARIKEFRSFFKDVKIISYRDANNIGLVNSFCESIGTPMPPNNLVFKKTRVSPSNIAALVMAELAKKQEVPYKLRRWLLDFSLSNGWPEPKKNVKRSLWPTPESHAAFIRRYQCDELSSFFDPVNWEALEHMPLSNAEIESYICAIEKAGGLDPELLQMKFNIKNIF